MNSETPTFDRITMDPQRMSGQPCMRGLRLTVQRVVELAASYSDHAALLREYPDLEEEDLRQALLFADATKNDRVEPLPAA